MKVKFHLHSRTTIFLLLLFCAIFTRLIHLDWGAPFFFHPDERNIAFSITQLEFPTNLNPHFFAYGSLPIYLIYFTSVLYAPLHNILFSTDFMTGWNVSFEIAILVSRFYSSFLSLLLLLVIFKITKILSPRTPPLLPVVFSIFSVGLIQYSHFGTFELWLTFFTALLFLSLLRFLKTQKIHYFFLQSLILGILLSIKISSLSLAPLLGVGLLWHLYKKYKTTKQPLTVMKQCFLLIIPGIVISIGILLATSPFILLDYNAFRSSINYESSVALGTLPVFYTGGFTNTIPVLYQLLKVYPFLLNPVMGILLIPFVLYFTIQTVRNKNGFFLVLLFLLFLLFFSQAFLYVKWSRYYIPTLPFLYILFSISLYDFYKKLNQKAGRIGFVLFSGILLLNILYSFIFIQKAYLSPDTRIEAASWASQNIPQDSRIISEVYDLGIVPFNTYFPSITLYNFYDLDHNPTLEKELRTLLETSEYIILPSTRIINSRISNPMNFPIGYSFYKELATNSNRYELIYQTLCDFSCKSLYLSPISSYLEETTSVFDRPTVSIYKIKN